MYLVILCFHVVAIVDLKSCRCFVVLFGSVDVRLCGFFCFCSGVWFCWCEAVRMSRLLVQLSIVRLSNKTDVCVIFLVWDFVACKPCECLGYFCRFLIMFVLNCAGVSIKRLVLDFAIV